MIGFLDSGCPRRERHNSTGLEVMPKFFVIGLSAAHIPLWIEGGERKLNSPGFRLF